MTVDPHPPATLDPRCNRIVAALTQRLAEAARQAHVMHRSGCGHDFLEPLLRPDFLPSGKPSDAASAHGIIP